MTTEVVSLSKDVRRRQYDSFTEESYRYSAGGVAVLGRNVSHNVDDVLQLTPSSVDLSFSTMILRVNLV